MSLASPTVNSTVHAREKGLAYSEVLPADRKRVIPAPRSGYEPRFSALSAG
jgi:hypothetical protein